MRLHDLQQQFLTAMYQENTDASPFIKASPLLSSNERLAIYRGSVRGGLLKAMSDIYPVVEKLLGKLIVSLLLSLVVEEH